MATFKITGKHEGMPSLDKSWEAVYAKMEVGGAIKTLSPLEAHTDRQRRWFKGVLLPALKEDTGDSVLVWENRLKREVMPDDFPPTVCQDGSNVYVSLPSIKTLGKKKMNQLIEGSVAHLRDKYELMWVTLPDSDLRK